MRRYFIAIQLPDDSKNRLLSMQPSVVPGMRLVGRDELHLTLHFLGELSDQSCELVRRALAAVNAAEFNMTITGLGFFSTDGEPKVLWSKVEKNPAIDSIHHSIGAALTAAIRFQLESRPYFPHVTLARFNGPCSLAVLENYLEQKKGFNISAVLVKQFALYSSIFVDGVPQYREEAVFTLFKD